MRDEGRRIRKFKNVMCVESSSSSSSSSTQKKKRMEMKKMMREVLLRASASETRGKRKEEKREKEIRWSRSDRLSLVWFGLVRDENIRNIKKVTKYNIAQSMNYDGTMNKTLGWDCVNMKCICQVENKYQHGGEREVGSR